MSLTVILILCNLATFVLTILTVIHTARLWRLRSIRYLLALSLTFIIGSFCLANVYIAQTFEEKVLFLHLRVLGMCFLAPCWLYFISSVFDRWNWLHKKWVTIFMFAPAALNFLMILFPFSRVLLFNNFQTVTYFGVTVVKYNFGSWYHAIYLWSMAQMVLSYVISIVVFVQSKGYRRQQVLILNVGLTVSLAQSLIAYFLKSAMEVEWIVTNTFSLLSTQIGIMYALLRHRLLSVVSLAMVRIFEQLPDPVIVLDDEKRVMGISEKGIKFFNISQNYLGGHFEEILPQVSLIPGELVVVGPDKELHYFHLALEKIGYSDESSSGTVVFFRDIGAQKKAELRLHEGMEFRARLLAFLAHDLSGFVAAQTLITDSLQRSIQQNAGPKYQEHFELIESSSMASQNLISNVMNWVQSQPMNFEPLKESFEMNALLKETLKQCESRLSLKKIEVVVSMPTNDVFIAGDSEMLASVFRNIFFNAVRATPVGKKIYVDLEANTTHLEIKIRDEGHGLEPEELERILAISSEFVLEGVPKTNGAGIGLMIARHFIYLHKGHFKMNTRLGEGTEVLFSVPL
ncbi:MAG: hypothetical protein K2Q18_14555 [Bdellovibrionales bacterium]|nr:hypothetical protein [Bdellovibrionales bacterium]